MWLHGCLEGGGGSRREIEMSFRNQIKRPPRTKSILPEYSTEGGRIPTTAKYHDGILLLVTTNLNVGRCINTSCSMAWTLYNVNMFWQIFGKLFYEKTLSHMTKDLEVTQLSLYQGCLKDLWNLRTQVTFQSTKHIFYISRQCKVLKKTGQIRIMHCKCCFSKDRIYCTG
jgi:hypothetical protein